MLPWNLMRPIARIRTAPIPGAALAAVLLAPWLPPSTASATPPAVVINGNDDGAGSLRAALESGATTITFGDEVTQITIESPLVYASTQALRIQGSGQSIVASGDHTLLIVDEGADLTISGIAFQGIGGFSAQTPGSGDGIVIIVPPDRVGVVDLELRDVSVVDVAGYGIHVSDCTLEDECGSGQGGGGEGSAASVDARLLGVVIEGVGHGRADADGFRIDERGAGDIVLAVGGSSFLGVGADGIELDEGNAGDVIVDV